mgnify:CR=1 FL=1
MPDRQRIVDAIEAYCRAETAKDRDGFLALFADDVVHEDPVGIASCVRRGREGVLALWQMVEAGDVTLRLTEPPIVRGDEAVALLASESGPPGQRRRIDRIVDLFRFDEAGLIVGVRAFYDF